MDSAQRQRDLQPALPTRSFGSGRATVGSSVGSLYSDVLGGSIHPSWSGKGQAPHPHPFLFPPLLGGVPIRPVDGRAWVLINSTFFLFGNAELTALERAERTELTYCDYSYTVQVVCQQNVCLTSKANILIIGLYSDTHRGINMLAYYLHY
jgi:hypothetical protein